MSLRTFCRKLVSSALAVMMLVSNFSWGVVLRQYLRAPNGKVTENIYADFKSDPKKIAEQTKLEPIQKLVSEIKGESTLINVKDVGYIQVLEGQVQRAIRNLGLDKKYSEEKNSSLVIALLLSNIFNKTEVARHFLDIKEPGITKGLDAATLERLETYGKELATDLARIKTQMQASGRPVDTKSLRREDHYKNIYGGDEWDRQQRKGKKRTAEKRVSKTKLVTDITENLAQRLGYSGADFKELVELFRERYELLKKLGESKWEDKASETRNDDNYDTIRTKYNEQIITSCNQIAMTLNKFEESGVVEAKEIAQKYKYQGDKIVVIALVLRSRADEQNYPQIVANAARYLGLETEEFRKDLNQIFSGGFLLALGGIAEADYYLKFVNKASKELKKKGINIEGTIDDIASSLKSENADGIEILLEEKGFSEGQILQVHSAIALEMDKDMGEKTNPLGKSESQVRKVVANGGKVIDSIDKVNSGVFISDQSMHNIGSWQAIKEFANGLGEELGKVKVYVEGEAKAIQDLGFTNVEVVEIGKVTKEEMEKRVGQRFVVIAADDEDIVGVDEAKILRLGKIEGNEMVLMPFALIKALKQLVGGGEELNQVLKDIALDMLTSLKNAGYINGELNTEERLRALASELVIGNTVPAIPVSENVSRDRYLFWKLAEKA